MKRLITKNNKATLLTQTGLALTFFLSGAGLAMAQPSIDAPMPGASAPAASVPTTAPAAKASAAASATASPAAPAAKGTLPSASKAEAATQPSSADLDVVESAPEDADAAPAPAKHEKKKHAAKKEKSHKEDGLKVTDILSTQASIRPLPHQYLVVKKVHNANDADARLTAARSALAQGNYQASLEIFDDLYRKSPRDMRVIMGRAVALQKLGQIDEAMDAYQVALRTDPHNIEALTNMLGLLRGKDTPTALKELRQLRDLYPANADVTAQLGMVYGVAGDYNNALKYLNMADALKPGNPTVLYNKAVAYDHMGNTAEAANLYHQILLLASDGVLDRSFPLEVVKERLATLR